MILTPKGEDTIMKRRIVLMGLFLILVIIGIVVFMSGCEPAVGNVYSSLDAPAPIQVERVNQDVVFAVATSAPGTAAVPPGVNQQRQVIDTQERLIVRNASLNLTLADPAAKIDEIEALAAELGGWVVSANLNTSGMGDEQRVTSANINIRVEAARLDEALDRIKTGVDVVNAESVTGEDVTAQYVDMRSRVANLEAAEQQLQTILEGARRTEDVLAVFDQLTRIRGEIESLRGQMQYFEQASSFSAIQVQLIATPITPPIEVGGWRPLDTVSGAAQALVNVLQGGANLLIILTVFALPLLLIVGLPLWFIVRTLRRRAGRRTAAISGS
jgi:hypothetical protein